VNEFCFRDRKGNPQVGTQSLDDAKKVLMGTDIGTYGVRAHSESQVVDI